MKTTAEILDIYRNKRKITQEELAEKCEISRPHLAHLLLGNKRPREKTLYKLMEVLKVDDEDRAEILLYEEYLDAGFIFRERYSAMEKKIAEYERLEKEVGEYKEFKEIFYNWIIKKKS